MADFRRSVFRIPKMDCLSEENIIRMALADSTEVASLDFDLQARLLVVTHRSDADAVLRRLVPLNFGAELVQTRIAEAPKPEPVPDSGKVEERRTLQVVLGINAVMFVVELALGIVAESTGLIADSLDMFADAAVYGLALYAVGHSAARKVRAAHLAGWLQLALAVGALTEVVRGFVSGSEPRSLLMWSVGLLALVANAATLVLVARQRDRGAHMTASYIFTANDVLANLGVIVAGALVWWTGSRYPDLIIGTIIGLVVLNGARRILLLR
jgi:Co/Zn/Cd efflux system component